MIDTKELEKRFFRVYCYHADYDNSIGIESNYLDNEFILVCSKEFKYYPQFVKYFEGNKIVFNSFKEANKQLKTFQSFIKSTRKLKLQKNRYILEDVDVTYELYSDYYNLSYNQKDNITIWEIYRNKKLIISTSTKSHAILLLAKMMEANDFKEQLTMQNYQEALDHL